MPPFLAHIPRPVRIALLLLVVGGLGFFALRAAGALGPARGGAIRASGIVEARTIEVASEVSGQVVQRPVDKGQAVRRGQLIAEIAVDIPSAQLSQAQAAAQGARDRLNQAEEAVRLQDDLARADVTRARAALGTAAAKSRDADAGARPQEIAEARAQVRQAAGVLAAARAQLRQLENGLRPEEIRQAEAAVRGAAADVAAARARLVDLQNGTRKQDLEQARAALDRAQAVLIKTRKDYEAARALLSDGAMSQEQFNAATEAKDAAEADVRAARERLSLLQEGPTAEQIKAARETLNRAVAAQQAAQEALALARKGPRQEEVARAGAAVAQARASYEAAAAHLDLTLAGTRRNQRAAARSQVDEARAALNTARDNQRQVALRQAEAAAARAAVAQAEAVTDQARVTLGKCRVTVPVPGLIDDTHVRVGETVKPGSSLVTLVDFSDTWVTVYVPEPLLGRLRVGQAARVTVDGLPNRPFAGTVRRVAAQAEFTPKYVQTTEERARTVFAVEIAVPNPDGALKPGMPADAVFQ